jgi:hypothetical protein
MARKLVLITVTLWAIPAFLLVAATREREVALLPLYGLYPGEMSSGETSYHPAWMHAWAVGMALVFLGLAVVALVRRSTPAGVAFLVLLILSTLAFLARFSNAMSGLH